MDIFIQAKCFMVIFKGNIFNKVKTSTVLSIKTGFSFKYLKIHRSV